MPLSAFLNPDDIESSAYRAIYEHLADTVDSSEESVDDTIARVLNEFVEQASLMLKTINRRGSLRIEFFGDELPVVSWPGRRLLDVTFVDGEAERLRELTYRGVSVYRTLKHGDLISDFWFASYLPCGWDSEDAFDVRELDVPPADFHPPGVDRGHALHMMLAWAIETGHLTLQGLHTPKPN